MDILYLVDRLEELVNEGWHIPLTTNVVIDEQEFLDIIDQMRISVPEEIKQAKRVQQEKDRLISQAKEEAERIVALAREESQSLLADHEILKAAETERQAIIEEGRKQVKVMRRDTDAYVIDVLSQLEHRLSGLTKTVHNGIISVQREARGETEPGSEWDEAIGSSDVQDTNLEAEVNPETPSE